MNDNAGPTTTAAPELAYKVGDVVTPRCVLGEHLADEGFGPSVCAKMGDKLIVREICGSGKAWQYAVSHEHVTDRTFGCNESELMRYGIGVPG